ncbi:hypothetical protein ACICHK_39115 [Streptomyces sp. AHU1]|uniref:hypothetical protein n=1 Tax=Streptomyces sp. AHU1 TaxID=3377215 RepID=UPI003877B2B0
MFKRHQLHAEVNDHCAYALVVDPTIRPSGTSTPTSITRLGLTGVTSSGWRLPHPAENVHPVQG